jgi:hypothetical protein
LHGQEQRWVHEQRAQDADCGKTAYRGPPSGRGRCELKRRVHAKQRREQPKEKRRSKERK